jgi:hypothetical protein
LTRITLEGDYPVADEPQQATPSLLIVTPPPEEDDDAADDESHDDPEDDMALTQRFQLRALPTV